MSELSAAAIDLVDLRCSVFPLQPREKKPYGRTPGLHAASRDIRLVRDWWAGVTPLPLKPDAAPGERPVIASPASNIGIATGSASGFWVLDLDGAPAEEALKALVEQFGALPETVEQHTGNGRHLCFAWDDRFHVRNSASRIGPGIDVRGDGGYIVAPPSVHPSGRRYAWCARRAPGEIAFAAAPDWLLQLAAPPEAPKIAAKSIAPPVRTGRASAYGEACLATSCRAVATAPAGKRRISVFNYAAFLGGFVAGGEIERSYVKSALLTAGLAQAQDKAWRHKDLEQLIENGLVKGERFPQTAPEKAEFARAAPRSHAAPASPAKVALDRRDARGIYDGARSADCGAVRDWFKLRSLAARDIPPALERMRAHAAVPIGSETVPGLILPLTSRADGQLEVEALAVIPLTGEHDRPAFYVGDRDRRVALLTPWPDDGELLIAVDLQDLWALGANARESGHDVGLVLAPTLRAFAGGYLGDRYGRADPSTPHADPDDPPWLAGGDRAVWLAVRGDLRTPELRSRRTWGGTARGSAEGDAAARFYGGLADQAWRSAGASKVNILRPTRGVGFSRRWGA